MKRKSSSRLKLSKRASCNPSRFRVFAGGLIIILSLSLNLSLLHAASFGLADRVVEQKLANGLTVLMVERHQTPVVSLNMTCSGRSINQSG